MATFTYTKPTVGGSEDTWGDTLNANWDAIAAFIGPLDSTELAVLDGITASTAELNLLDGVTWTLTDYNTLTATATELNLLDGVTATTAEINYLSGVTSAIQDQIDNIPAPPELTQVQAEDDTSTVFGQVSGQRLAQAFNASEQQVGVGQTWQSVSGSRSAQTSYQNTTGRPIMFYVQLGNQNGNTTVQVSSNNSTWIEVGSSSNNAGTTHTVIVPDDYYYRVSGTASLNAWSELR